MATIKEKLATQTSAKPHKIMETNFDNINMSRDQHILHYRKKEEIEAKLELEKKRLEELALEEEKALENAGNEDNKENEKTKTNEEV